MGILLSHILGSPGMAVEMEISHQRSSALELKFPRFWDVQIRCLSFVVFVPSCCNTWYVPHTRNQILPCVLVVSIKQSFTVMQTDEDII